MEGAIEAEEMSLQKMPMICEDSCEKSSEMSFHVNKKRSGLVYTNIKEQDFLEFSSQLERLLQVGLIENLLVGKFALSPQPSREHLLILTN